MAINAALQLLGVPTEHTGFIETPVPYVGPLDLVPGAIVAYGQRALSSAKRGTALYTIRRDSDSTTQTFNSDAVTGAAPVASVNTFIGTALTLKNVTIAAIGSGYDNGVDQSTFDVTLVGGTSTVAAVVNVTTDGAGGIYSINSITNAGAYTVAPASPNSPTGNDGVNIGSGLELNIWLNNCGVTSWKDQSGNASHMLQATSGRQPVWQAALGDAQPSLQFVAAGADLLATAAAINLTDPGITVFTVMIPTEAGADLLSLDTFGEGWATSSGGMINYWQGRAAPDAVGVYVLNYLDDASGVGPVYTSSSLTEYNDGLIHLWDVALDGANAPYNGTLAVDGEAWPNTGDPGSSGFSGLSWRMALGNNDSTRGLGAASYFDGQIFEFIVYPSKLSDADRALVRANIAAYYGITLE